MAYGARWGRGAKERGVSAIENRVEERTVFDFLIESFDCSKKFCVADRWREKNFVIKV